MELITNMEDGKVKISGPQGEKNREFIATVDLDGLVKYWALSPFKLASLSTGSSPTNSPQFPLYRSSHEGYLTKLLRTGSRKLKSCLVLMDS